MKTVIKYSNRKLYDKESSKYINLKDLMDMQLGSFKVIEKDTGNDITLDTMLSYLASNTVDAANDSKVKVMKHCIDLLSA